jgi:CopG family transcriptional regulator/antitoxin EndoAI
MKTAQRINITLPEDTLRLLDRVAPKGDRSRFIAKAVRFYVEKHSRAELRRLLKVNDLQMSGRDRRLAEKWYPIRAA